MPDRRPQPAPVADRRERRLDRRDSAVLLLGKVTRGDRVGVCLIHDISAGGAKARFTVPPAVGDVLTIETRGLPATVATVRWVRREKAGIQFAERQDIAPVFLHHHPDGLVVRPPRFALSTPASIRLDSGCVTARTIDVSAGGVKLCVQQAVEPSQAGPLSLPDSGATMFGRICWVRDDRCGFRFCTPLALAALSEIIGR